MTEGTLYNIVSQLLYFDMCYIATAIQNYCIKKELIEWGNRKDFA